MPENDVIFTGPDFYISYLENRGEVARMLNDFIFAITGEREPKELPETALCIREPGKGLWSIRFLILYGDHREEYRKRVPDLNACIDYFRANINQMGHSSDLPDTAH